MESTNDPCAFCRTELAPTDRACPRCGCERSSTPAPRPFEPGLVLDGRWKLLELLGQGGMGSVWLGVDQLIPRRVAIKVVRNPDVVNTEQLARFDRETRLLARVDHPNVVMLYAAGTYARNRYLVLRYVDGQPLQELLGKKVPRLRVLGLARQLCEGLAAIHAVGVVHRDIKPANIVISPDGHLTIIDLGLACEIAGVRLTRTGIMYGSVGFAAPEQIAALPVIDQRADVYSAAVLIFQMLTGRLPFVGPDEDKLLLAQVKDPPPDGLDLGLTPAVSAVLQKGLATKREDRYGTVKELLAAFTAAIEQSGTAGKATDDEPATSAPRVALSASGKSAGEKEIALLLSRLSKREALKPPPSSAGERRAMIGEEPTPPPAPVDPSEAPTEIESPPAKGTKKLG